MEHEIEKKKKWFEKYFLRVIKELIINFTYVNSIKN